MRQTGEGTIRWVEWIEWCGGCGSGGGWTFNYIIRAKNPLHPLLLHRFFLTILAEGRIFLWTDSPCHARPTILRGRGHKTLASLDAANLIFTLRPLRKLPKCYNTTHAVISPRYHSIYNILLYIYYHHCREHAKFLMFWGVGVRLRLFTRKNAFQRSLKFESATLANKINLSRNR